MRRRRAATSLAVIVVLALLAPIGSSHLVSHLGGAWEQPPEDLNSFLSENARSLVEDAFSDVDDARLLDHHVHIAGMGRGDSGCSVHPDTTSWLHPLRRIRYEVYLSAAGVDDPSQADQQYVERLIELVQHTRGRGRYLLLPFDRHYHEDGRIDLDGTEFHVPDAYTRQLARSDPQRFISAISVHPYRHDALDALEQGAAAGARVVKWLPNAQGIDPASDKCDAFYRKMKQLDLILLSHAGEEQAVESKDDQRLGNPLRLRRALDHGVRVIVAHCASFGRDVDLDAPHRPLVASFDLFLRMMAEERYEGLLFGEISALVLANRMGRPLLTMLARTDLHPRLVNGSDYPMPAINILVRTGRMVDEGLLSMEQRDGLNEIYRVNPLLFDYVLKRTLRHPKTGSRFAASIFVDNPALNLLSKPAPVALPLQATGAAR